MSCSVVVREGAENEAFESYSLMVRKATRSAALWILASIFSAGLSNAAPAPARTPSDGLAARAVAQAKLMKPGRPRDVTLREISRNLRHAERDRAFEAASAMSDDYELRSFAPGAGKPDRLLAEQHRGQSGEAEQCTRYIEGLKAGSSKASEERVRACLLMDDPPGIVARPLPPYRIVMAAADGLPPGRTKAELLYMATWENMPERPVGGALVAVRQLRALLPSLGGNLRRETTGWLDTTSVDLIEGRPEAAIARVREAFRHRADAEASLADAPASKAQSLISDFLSAKDIERAVTVTNLLSPSDDCSMIFNNLPAVFQWVLPTQQDGAIVGKYLDQLQKTGTWTRLCPNGVDRELVAEVWLNAGNEAKALEEASAFGKPIVLAKTRIGIAERRLKAGDIAGAKTVITAATHDLPPLVAGTPDDRSIAAHLRIRLIHQVARLGDVIMAERLAADYPGPGWRGFAYSVIVATLNRDRAGPTWGGPFLDLQEVSSEL